MQKERVRVICDNKVGARHRPSKNSGKTFKKRLTFNFKVLQYAPFREKGACERVKSDL